MKFLKRAAIYLREEEERQAPARALLVRSLATGGLATGAEAGTDRRSCGDRLAARRSRRCPPLNALGKTAAGWTILLNQMHTLLTANTHLGGRAMGRGDGVTPLRLWDVDSATGTEART